MQGEPQGTYVNKMEQLKWVALLYEIVLEEAKSTASQDYTLKRSKGENYHFHISYEPKVGSRLSLLWMHRLQLRFDKGINREAWEKRKRSETWVWGKGCQHLCGSPNPAGTKLRQEI